MTSLPIMAATGPASRLPAGHYRFAGAARMEWIKLRSLRSTRWTVLVMAAGMIGLGILALRWYPSHWQHLPASQKASFDPVNQGFTGVAIAQLAMGIIGVLVMTSEYSSGMIRAALAAVPDRRLLLAAKAAVLGLAALVAGEFLSFVTFLAGQAVLTSPAPRATLGQPGVLRAVLLAGAYLCLIGLIGLGIGAIIRHSAGAIAALVGLVLVLPLVLVALPGSVQHSAGRYLPVMIAENSLTVTRPVPFALSPWAGLGMLCLYAAAALAAGGLLLARRDA
jgi:ABC-2 type transport system permease protein